MLLERPQSAAIISKTLQIKGEVRCAEDLVVQGTIEGTITQAKDLFIDQGGEIRANISGPNIQIAGRVIGSISATEKVEILPTGVMIGDILAAARIEIMDGAKFKGRIDMGDITETPPKKHR